MPYVKQTRADFTAALRQQHNATELLQIADELSFQPGSPRSPEGGKSS